MSTVNNVYPYKIKNNIKKCKSVEKPCRAATEIMEQMGNMMRTGLDE